MALTGLDQAEAGEVGFGGEELEGGAQGGDHLVGPVGLGGGGGGDQLVEVVADGVEGGEEAVLLALEDARRSRGSRPRRT